MRAGFGLFFEASSCCVLWVSHSSVHSMDPNMIHKSHSICVQTLKPLPVKHCSCVDSEENKTNRQNKHTPNLKKPYITAYTGNRDAHSSTWKFRQKWDVIEYHVWAAVHVSGCTHCCILSSVTRMCFRCHLQKWDAAETCRRGKKPFISWVSAHQDPLTLPSLMMLLWHM